MKTSISGWSAWAPGMQTRKEWQQPQDEKNLLESLQYEGEPDAEWIPARKRRRCSKLTRIALHVAKDCCDEAGVDPGTVKSVFATRHGEINLTVNILKTLADDELVSPMAFGNSVHNTPSSYFSILLDNERPTRTISAREDTFLYGFLDAAGMVEDPSEPPVLFVCISVAPPEPLQQLMKFEYITYGTALLLNSPGSGQDLELTFTDSDTRRSSSLPSSVSFLQWFLQEEKSELSIPGIHTSRSWNWKRL